MKKILSVILIFLSCTVYAQDAGAYHLLNSYHIQSAGKWDYIALSPVGDNIYVAHGNQVNILDKTNGDSIGVIKNTNGVHGIAFCPDNGKGFISNGALNTVTVFDLATSQVQAEIKTGQNPDAIMYDQYSKKIYVCNGRSMDLTIIDPLNNKVVTTIPLGGKPETAVTDEAGNVYINIEDKDEIVRLNANRLEVIAHWPLKKGKGPSGLAIDKNTKRLYAGCDDVLVVMNAGNGNIVTTMPIGAGCDGVGFDAALRLVFSSNGDGTLDIIKELTPDKYKEVQKLITQKGARTLAVDNNSHMVYLPTADFGTPAAGEKRAPMVPGTFRILVVGK